MHWKQKGLMVAGLALLGLPGYSQTGSSSSGASDTSAQPGATTPPSKWDATQDKLLLTFLHRDNQNEIALAKLAKENGSSKEVKDFADHIVKDHQSADDQVMALAKRKNIDLSAAEREISQMSKERLEEERRSRAVGTATGEWAFTWENELRRRGENQVAMDKLRKLKGAEFDREFARVMVDNHQAAVDRLLSARTSVRDTDMVNLLDKLLPIYKQHVSMAQKLQASVSKA
jgi:predicted outer membrane protein